MLMEKSFKGKSFLKVSDFTKEELEYLINLAIKLKRDKKAGKEVKQLVGKNIALIFEKTSTRTRCAFEVSGLDQGANISYISSQTSQMRSKESMKDSARVLGRMFDAIGYRGFDQINVEILKDYSKLPVWNGLTTEAHPTQVLGDFMTILEHIGYLEGVKFAYVGDARNNVANSLMIGAAKFGLDFRVVSHSSLFPDKKLVDMANEINKTSGGKLTLTESVELGVKDADVIYTDVWLSMGEDESVWDERIKLLTPYQINSELVKHAQPDYIFMHCLPAYHNLETDVGQEIYAKYGLEAMEVTEEIFEGNHSVVFDEAENRLHTIKAVMVATLGNK